MKNGLFHFKQFSVSHSRSSMKVGVDGVLIGCWAQPKGKRILDAGTGCGLIALILAQRVADAEILAIDIDGASVEEAKENFANSPWHARLSASVVSYNDISEEDARFDLIVSNPPFYDSGVSDFSSARNIARHQGNFSPALLIEKAVPLLNENGRLSMIVPAAFFDELREKGISMGMVLDRGIFVKDHSSSIIKRVLMEFVRPKENIHDNESLTKDTVNVLTMFQDNGEPTPEYKELCRDFYLKF